MMVRIGVIAMVGLVTSCGSSSVSKLVITGQTPITNGTCTAYTVTRTDSSGVAAKVSSNNTIGVALASGSSGAVYPDSACTLSSVTQVTMLSGNNAVTFFYKPTATGQMTLTAQSMTFASDSQAYLTVTVQ